MGWRYVGLALIAALEAVIALVGRSHRTCALLLAPGFERVRWRMGRWRAWRAFHRARRAVPAYRRFVAAMGVRDFTGAPETDKARYIAPNRLEDLCRRGRIPQRGVVLDESSGSSGAPTTWVRGAAERRATARMLRATFLRSVEGPVVVLNAFALGAWATGMNVTMALTDICRIKSTGPDLDKVIETITRLGHEHRYVVLAYPPLLKDIADDPRIDLAAYDVIAGFGGEGLSENMRSYLLRSYRKVIGSYGASDLEINIAAETEFTIALRRELVANHALRRALTRPELGVAPMIFQYNPLDYVIETNAAGELLITLCRAATLSPRIRYNIHDLGHVVRMRDVRRLLSRHGAAHLRALARTDLPLVFHYGRSDASLDYYGAVVTPDGLREALYGAPELADRMREFRLVAYEDRHATKQLVFAVELQPGHAPDGLDEDALGAKVVRHLAARNGDFANACRIAAAYARPQLRLFRTGTGPFAGEAALKYRYLSQLDRDRASQLGLAS